MSATACRIIPVRMLIANAFLIQGDRTVIVDTGFPGNAAKILAQLARSGVAPREVSLILLTHGHVDHFGCAAELRECTGAPIAIHQADAPALRAGHNPPLQPACAMGRLMRPIFQHRQLPPCEPDLLLDEHTRLNVFGVAAEIVATPGHTAGSISVLLSDGDLIVGDLLMGGALGGQIAPTRPGLPYFLDDLTQTLASVQRVLELPVSRIHVGHGGPLEAGAVRRWLATVPRAQQLEAGARS